MTLLRPPAFVREVMNVVEASRRHNRWPCRRTRPIETRLTLVPRESEYAPAETELLEAGARRLLAALDELSQRGERAQHG